MAPLERPTDSNLREHVLKQVRSEIISGQSAPGTMYSVPTLASTLGVSTTPVREALLELARIGLVEPMRNRGFRVVAPSLAQLRSLFDLREVLELYGVELVALKRKKDLAPLRLIAENIAKTVSSGSTSEYLEADRQFHFLLTDLADNELLTENVMSLRDRMRLYGISSDAGRERQIESVTEHFRIIELAEVGDVDGLRELLRHHIRSWQPIFTDALLELTRKGTSRLPS